MQIATPGGLPLPAFYGPMLAPVTTLAITSLADFSARHPQGGARSGATNEGVPQQCFDKAGPCCGDIVHDLRLRYLSLHWSTTGTRLLSLCLQRHQAMCFADRSLWSQAAVQLEEIKAGTAAL